MWRMREVLSFPFPFVLKVPSPFPSPSFFTFVIAFKSESFVVAHNSNHENSFEIQALSVFFFSLVTIHHQQERKVAEKIWQVLLSEREEGEAMSL